MRHRKFKVKITLSTSSSHTGREVRYCMAEMYRQLPFLDLGPQLPKMSNNIFGHVALREEEDSSCGTIRSRCQTGSGAERLAQ